MSSLPLPRLLRVLPPLVAVGLALHHGPALIDDAYITFRYAENLIAGHGLVFNPGERVLGTSSPLMALLVAAGIALGAPAPAVALMLDILSVAVLVHVIEVLARAVLPPRQAWACAGLVALHPALTYAATSGMETALSMLAVYGAFALALRGRARLAGVVAGLATLLRPDGAVVIALLLAWSVFRRREAFKPIAVCASLVVVPAACVAWSYYGALLPHSVAAKHLTHADTVPHILAGAARFLTGLPVFMLVAVLALAGAAQVLRTRGDLLLVPAWLTLQLAGLASAGIQAIFPWYFCPFHPGLVLLAGIGIVAVTAPVAPRTTSVCLGALASALLFSAPSYQRRMDDAPSQRRTALYLELGKGLASSLPPGAAVFLGEVGALSWTLPAQRIIDSAGINSPIVHAARQADLEHLRAQGAPVEQAQRREGSIAWVQAVIASTQPVLIVTFAPWMHIEALAREPRFAADYERLAWPPAPEMLIYRRRAGSADPR